MNKKLLLVGMFLISSFSMAKIVNVTEEVILSNDGKVISRYDSGTKTFLIQGEGKIDEDKFTDLITSIHMNNMNTKDYTIKFESNKILLTDRPMKSLFNSKHYDRPLNTPTNPSGAFLPAYIDIAIEMPDDFDARNIASTRQLFQHNRNVKVDFSNWDVSNILDMDMMFYDSTVDPDITTWDLRNMIRHRKENKLPDNKPTDPKELEEWNKKYKNISNITILGSTFRKIKWVEEAVKNATNEEIEEAVKEEIRDLTYEEKRKKEIEYHIGRGKKPITKEDIERYKRERVINPNSYIDKLNVNLFEFLRARKNKQKMEKTEAIFRNRFNKDVVENLENNYYFEYEFGKTIKGGVKKEDEKLSIKDFFNLARTGISLKVKDDLDLRVGGFLEYNYDFANNIGVGATLKYDGLSSFIRYRYVFEDKQKNHNVDIYARYNKEFDLGKNIYLTPKAGAMLSVSSKVDVHKYLYRKAGVSFNGDLSLKGAYKIKNTEIYLTPEIGVRYNDAVYQKDNSIIKFWTEEQQAKVKPKEDVKYVNDKVSYNVELGVNHKFENGVNLRGAFDFGGTFKEEMKFKLKLGTSYNW